MSDLLFFDLDGTLGDTHNLARAIWLEVLRPHGSHVVFKFYQDHIRGQPTTGASLVVGDFAGPVLHDVLEQPTILRDAPVKRPGHLS